MKRKNLLKIAVLVIIIVQMSSCSDLLMGMFGSTETVTMKQRIEQFVIDLNNDDRTNLIKNFHEDQTEDYGAYQDSAGWDAIFPVADEDYVITYKDPTGTPATTITTLITGGGFFIDDEIIFEMLETETDSNIWQIKTLTITTTTEDLIVKTIKF